MLHTVLKTKKTQKNFKRKLNFRFSRIPLFYFIIIIFYRTNVLSISIYDVNNNIQYLQYWHVKNVYSANEAEQIDISNRIIYKFRNLNIVFIFFIFFNRRLPTKVTVIIAVTNKTV